MHLNIVIERESIERTRATKNLGVLMHDTLRFYSHVLDVTRNCLFLLKVLYEMREFLNKQLRVRFSHSLVLSPLNYGDVV